MKNEKLELIFSKEILPNRIKFRIKDVLDEDPAYAADELVELSEEILFQLSAIGMSIYLNQSNQKDVFNDFIIDLFTVKSHSYNAGPLFKWTAHMVKDLEGDDVSLIKPFFWSKGEQKELILNPDLIRLSELRNAVMHGFFILPPERNQEEATHLGNILNQLIELNIFKLNSKDENHFMDLDNGLVSFKGDWKINSQDWIEYTKCYDFGRLSSKIQYETSHKYEDDQKSLVENTKNSDESISSIKEFLKKDDKGSLGYWVRPNQDTNTIYSSLCLDLEKEKEFLPIYQSLENLGINFTSDFLLGRVVKRIANHSKDLSYSTNNKKALVQLRKKCRLKPIIIIDKIHTALFKSEHLLHLFNLFYENNIQVVAFGIRHPWMDQFFNQSLNNYTDTVQPSREGWQTVLSNYLRFKGPDQNIAEQKKEYDLLLNITETVIQELEKNSVTARRFADKHKFPMEYVHEVFDALSPFYTNRAEAFEMDVLDELYNFPKEITEASRVLFSIGRRDTKLEYQHKILKK